MSKQKTPEELAEEWRLCIDETREKFPKARQLYREELKEKLENGGSGLTQTDLAYLGYLLCNKVEPFERKNGSVPVNKRRKKSSFTEAMECIFALGLPAKYAAAFEPGNIDTFIKYVKTLITDTRLQNQFVAERIKSVQINTGFTMQSGASIKRLTIQNKLSALRKTPSIK